MVNQPADLPVDFVPSKASLILNKIYQQDCVEGMKEMGDDSVDLVIADPPYNLSKGSRLEAPKVFHSNWSKVMEGWDDIPFVEYFNFTVLWLTEARRVLKPTGSMWVYGTYHNIGVVNVAMQLLDIKILNEVVWYKRNATPNVTCRRLTASHEIILWAWKDSGKGKYKFNYEVAKELYSENDNLKKRDRQLRTVWDIPNNKQKSETQFGKHPTQKPIAITNRIIVISSQQEDVILVPFAGSGTECVAAKDLNRHYIGFELNDEYVKLANKRLNNVHPKLI